MKTTRIWLLRCLHCLSHRVDLLLGGQYSFQMYKCLDCGYIGTNFIEVEETLPPKKDAKDATQF